MLTLTLMRHGKAEVGSPSGNDIDRPLAPRGERAAMMAGKVLIERGIRPDVVLCSSARRTRETLDGVIASLPERTEVKLDPDLYLAEPDDLLGTLKELDGNAASVLIIGHNPGLHELAVALVGNAAPESDLKTLQSRFPTAALAVLTFEAESWSKVAWKDGTLVAFDLSARVN